VPTSRTYCHNCAFTSEIIAGGAYCDFCLEHFYTFGRLPQPHDRPPTTLETTYAALGWTYPALPAKPVEPPKEAHMTTRRYRRGSTGWACVAAGVILWVILAEDDEQLTYSFRRGCRTKPGQVLVIASWGLLTGHLFAVLPTWADPIHQIGILLRRRPINGREGSLPQGRSRRA